MSDPGSRVLRGKSQPVTSSSEVLTCAQHLHRVTSDGVPASVHVPGGWESAEVPDVATAIRWHLRSHSPGWPEAPRVDSGMEANGKHA